MGNQGDGADPELLEARDGCDVLIPQVWEPARPVRESGEGETPVIPANPLWPVRMPRPRAPVGSTVRRASPWVFRERKEAQRFHSENGQFLRVGCRVRMLSIHPDLEGG